MAVENLVGSLVATPFATEPPTLVDSALAGGRVRVCTDKVEVTAAASDTSTYVLGIFPTNAVLLLDSKIHFDDLASTGAPVIDLGISPVDDNFTVAPTSLRQGIDVATAAGSASLHADITDVGQKLWELAGLSADPGGQCQIIVTIDDADVNTGGDLVLDARYSVD